MLKKQIPFVNLKKSFKDTFKVTTLKTGHLSPDFIG